jgi:hypothetical protein
MQELSSGGVLIEVSDQGIGVSEARLTDMNWRLDNPPTIDVSVSRHMGLFAVARLAERHRVRVRLRPAQPQGLSALVWLPDSIVARTTVFGAGGRWQSPAGVGYAAQSTGAREINGTPGGAVALAPNGNGNGHGPSAGGPRVAQGLFRSGEPEGAAGGPRVAQGLFRGGEPEGAAGGPRVAQGPFRGGEPEEAAGSPRVAQGLFRGGDAEDMDRSGPPQWSAPSSPSYDDQTSAGLPIRARKASLAPDPGSGGGTGGLPQRSDFARGGPAPGSGRGTGSQPLPDRSPDQVRSRLAGFQRGTRRAEAEQGQSARAAEGSER